MRQSTLQKNRKTLISVIGFSCNNNCIICSFGKLRGKKPIRTTSELIEEFKKARKEGFVRVCLMGGEPTIRKDILQLLRYADALGFSEISISSNGRMFCNADFCQKLIERNLARVNITLYGHTPKIHDSITRVKGSFDQTVKGIRNLRKYPNIKLCVNTVISSLNIHYLAQIASFVYQSLGVSRWAIMDLIPCGNALSFYKRLSIRLTNLSQKLSDVSGILPKMSCVYFFDFAQCLFSPSFRSAKEVAFFDAKERYGRFEQRGYHPSRFVKKRDRYYDKRKVKLAICQNCKLDSECAGIWKRYVELYGEDEVAVLANKHGLLVGH